MKDAMKIVSLFLYFIFLCARQPASLPSPKCHKISRTSSFDSCILARQKVTSCTRVRSHYLVCSLSFIAMSPQSPNGSQLILETQGLAKSFLGLQALQDFSIVVHPDEILGLIGPNGAGKTTCFNLLTGFLLPTAGKI